MTDNNELKQQLAQQLDLIFAAYPATAAITDLRAEVSAKLLAMATAKITAGEAPAAAVKNAIAEYGAIAPRADQLVQRHPNLPAAKPADRPQSELHASLRGITKLNVAYQGDAINIVTAPIPELRVHEHFASFKPESAGTITQTGSVLTVQGGDRKSVAPAKITLAVPADFTGQLRVTSQDGSVAAASLRGLVAVNIAARVGSVQLAYLASRVLSVTTTAGNITLQGSQIGSAELSSTDGNLLIAQLAAEELTARSTRGDIRAEKLNVTNAARLFTEAGNLSVKAVKAQPLTLAADDK